MDLQKIIEDLVDTFLSAGKLSRHADKMEYVGSVLSKQD